MDTHNKNGFILYVLNVLRKYSDENHILSSSKIASLVNKEYGETINKKTVVNYINLLSEKFGYDIDMFADNKKGYFLRRDNINDFELGELSAIINTFAYSNFIPEKMSNEITKKCLNMMNVYEREKYKNYKSIIKDTKSDNMEIIKNIEDVNEAIYKAKKISFEYFKYEINGSKLNKKSENVVVSPYKLVYVLQKFYLVCNKVSSKKLYTYRLDKMKNVNILKEKSSKKFEEYEIELFIKSNVSMMSGEYEKVEIECDKSLLDTVIETYGKDIVLKEVSNAKFYASFYTTITGFKYWCIRNLDKVKVLSPKGLVFNIKKEMKDYLK